jgi:16S rRNA (cytidine1402-2'-O)-methyltransferase
VDRMRDGAVVALVSDAGMPLVSDPGYVLVQGCVAAGLEVEVLPGPSAALAALVASALPSDAWRFVGFLPRKRGQLVEVLASPETVVAFESPRRVAASLAVLADVDPSRPAAVCRELTKVHEEVVRGTAAELAARYADEPPRGEVVLVVGGAPPRGELDPAAVDAVRRLVEAGARARAAAGVVGELTGAPANALYRAVVAPADEGSTTP